MVPTHPSATTTSTGFRFRSRTRVYVAAPEVRLRMAQGPIIASKTCP